MSELSVELLQPRQVPSAVSLIQASFSRRLLQFMIYGQKGVVDFLTTVIQGEGDQRKSEFLVIPGASAEVMACAEFTFPDKWTAHLAYLAVNPDQRGRGLATQMMREFVSRHPEIRSIRLEVFTDNEPAQKLYRGLGFVAESGSTWRCRELPEAYGRIEIDNLSAAEAMFSRFGFCQLQAEGSGGKVKFGRLGERIVRIYNLENFSDDNLLASVRAQFPSTTTAFIVDSLPRALNISATHSVLAESIQMRLELVGNPNDVDDK